MKKIIASLMITGFLLSGMVLANGTEGVVNFDTEGFVGLGFSITPGTSSFGEFEFGVDTSANGSGTQTIENLSQIALDLSIKGSNASTSADGTWSLVHPGSVGLDAFGLERSYNGTSTSPASTTYSTLGELPGNATSSLDFIMHFPTASSKIGSDGRVSAEFSVDILGTSQ